MTTFLKIFISLVLAGMLAWIAYAVIAGRYLEAVAVSCIGPVLLWFMTGAGNGPGTQVDEDGKNALD